MRSRDHLVMMANQIALNLATLTEGDAAAALADHVASFWEPRMTAALIADPSGLSPVGASAFALLAANGPPPSQTPATRFDPARSDAG